MADNVKEKSAELAKQLWAIANEFRGNMDASEFKNYILGLIFYRYLSEKTGVPADTALVKMPRQDSWREQVTDVLGSIAGDIADRISSRSAPSFRYQLY